MPATSERANDRFETQRTSGLIRFGFWFCVVIAVVVVVRRLFALASPAQSGPPEMVAMDAVFAGHAGLTLAHIVPAMLFVLVAPLALWHKTRGKGWVQGLFYVLGTWTGLTAYAMSTYSIGGWIERSAVFCFDTLFLFALIRSFLLRGEPAAQWVWMIRAVGILLGIATTRPVMGIFFATSQLTHMRPNQFFGIAFWIGFAINLTVVELWLWHLKSQPRQLG